MKEIINNRYASQSYRKTHICGKEADFAVHVTFLPSLSPCFDSCASRQSAIDFLDGSLPINDGKFRGHLLFFFQMTLVIST